ncbi:hypothetical protein PVAP13_1KG194877 [Panicum virgatum]|uniref:Uncharacterized protein n=1 Tax=Panicum virgatum TaxID=38727 RepID=A0A8T0X600_PANVG|nr:hypothetical protein PVAP13_1KG194877 [Panicum virgatum]
MWCSPPSNRSPLKTPVPNPKISFHSLLTTRRRRQPRSARRARRRLRTRAGRRAARGAGAARADASLLSAAPPEPVRAASASTASAIRRRPRATLVTSRVPPTRQQPLRAPGSPRQALPPHPRQAPRRARRRSRALYSAASAPAPGAGAVRSALRAPGSRFGPRTPPSILKVFSGLLRSESELLCYCSFLPPRLQLPQWLVPKARVLTWPQAVASGLTWLMALVAKAALLAVGARQRQTTLRWFVKMLIGGINMAETTQIYNTLQSVLLVNACLLVGVNGIGALLLLSIPN